MNINSILALMLGLVVRLGLPLLVTVLIVYGLRRLDIRWQKEAEIERNLLVRDEEPCWKEQGLSMEEIKSRAAESGKPCWQIHRLSNGYLREACLDCEVFIHAPAPVLKQSKAHA
jgi:predicted nucleic acid-binding protein